MRKLILASVAAMAVMAITITSHTQPASTMVENGEHGGARADKYMLAKAYRRVVTTLCSAATDEGAPDYVRQECQWVDQQMPYHKEDEKPDVLRKEAAFLCNSAGPARLITTDAVGNQPWAHQNQQGLHGSN
jgi:hypothetical protein